MPPAAAPKPLSESAQPPARAASQAASSAASKPLSGPQRALHKLGLVRDADLALHLPLRYEDQTRLVPIASLREGVSGQVQGQVLDCRVETRSRRQLLVRIDDGSGELLLRLLHFYPSTQKTMAPGALLRVRGELRSGFLGREMVHPEVQAVAHDTPLPAGLTPVYPSSAGLPQAYLRKVIASALPRAHLAELLPPALLPAGLPPLREALEFLHRPPPGTDLEALSLRRHPAWHRLKFEELLAQQLAQAQSRAARARLCAPSLRPLAEGGLAARLLAVLPFALTAAQRRVVAEIEADLARPAPMHRLLQGDVGSGKTVVAALAAAVAVDSGWQCALMAPTEILAEQHFRKLVQWLEPLGVGLAWLTGSRKGRSRAAMLQAVADGRAALVVGTHAVIQHDVAFARLGLAIVDEQHRFGVAQRLALRDKRVAADAVAACAPGPQSPALEPHLLMMSATPIPRTLAMSHYADLELSTLDELPPGRSPIVTKVFADTRRAQVLDRVRNAVATGQQVYWVCPLVEESEHLDLQNATATHAELAALLAERGAQAGLLHGRMAAADKAAVMAQFSAGALQLLVATTVIEVGVDVPNASLMVIEHAERFGLAQLHQLRGRVGRGSVASVCVLLYTSPLSATGRARLRAMAETTDGFEIARRDLDIRGPGEFMGARQSGDALLRFADLAEDEPLLLKARAAAVQLLRESPELAERQVQRWLAHKTEYLKA